MVNNQLKQQEYLSDLFVICILSVAHVQNISRDKKSLQYVLKAI